MWKSNIKKKNDRTEAISWKKLFLFESYSCHLYFVWNQKFDIRVQRAIQVVVVIAVAFIKGGEQVKSLRCWTGQVIRVLLCNIYSNNTLGKMLSGLSSILMLWIQILNSVKFHFVFYPLVVGWGVNIINTKVASWQKH